MPLYYYYVVLKSIGPILWKADQVAAVAKASTTAHTEWTRKYVYKIETE